MWPAKVGVFRVTTSAVTSPRSLVTYLTVAVIAPPPHSLAPHEYLNPLDLAHISHPLGVGARGGEQLKQIKNIKHDIALTNCEHPDEKISILSVLL